jgi:Acetyltransferase (isoleucine patch superfamily)
MGFLGKIKRRHKKKVLFRQFKSVGLGTFEHVSSGVSFIGPEFCSLGSNASIPAPASISCIDLRAEGSNFAPSLSIGNNFCANTGFSVFCGLGIQIGDNCLFGPDVLIMDSDHGDAISDVPYQKQCRRSAKVLIGNNVYLGARVVVLKGVTIGDNVIIGSNSVVTHDIPANSKAGGIPAKVLRVWDAKTKTWIKPQ